MQIPNRPTAYGAFFPTQGKGKVDFTDDQEYKMTWDSNTATIDWDGLERPWSGDKPKRWDDINHWEKTTPDIAGQYNHIIDTDQSCDIVITRGNNNRIRVDWSGCNNRVDATGFVKCPTGCGKPFVGKVDFPDDKIYRLAFFANEGKIYWDGVEGPRKTSNIWVLDETVTADYNEGSHFDIFELWEDDGVWKEVDELGELLNFNEDVVNGVEIFGVIMDDNVMKIGIGSVVVVVMLVIIAGVYCIWKRKENKKFVFEEFEDY